MADDADLVVSSSMPVRDLEWFGGSRARAFANRGANGIDGVLGTALGRALAGRPTFALLGDLAFVHDSNALTALERRGVDLRIVVVDNDGGGIFSFLPQATALTEDRFETLFGTPLGVDVVALATAYGLEARTVQAVDELIDQLGQPGPWVCCVPTERRHNVEVHAQLHEAVTAAVDADLL
jgi:2-succinyl-5-enolpyruvyl-6-hydroxy-3-cyclohexene-1-carboxylate synthase